MTSNAPAPVIVYFDGLCEPRNPGEYACGRWYVPPEPTVPALGEGILRLNTLRVGHDAGQIAEEIIGQLSALPGAEVEVVLDIRADVPDGVPDDVVRTVTENAATLKFVTQGFEED